MRIAGFYKFLIFIGISLVYTNANGQFINFGPAKDFLELDVHFQAGGSGVFQNYMKKFPEIKELNTMASTSYGIGARAVFGIKDFIGFGTELNLKLDGYNLDLAVSNDNGTNVSNIFLHNRYLYAHIPVFVSFRFNASTAVRWNVDFGMYYEYGFAGKQKQSIYTTSLNELGQLVPQEVYLDPSYFVSDETFINSFFRSDIGFHIATGLRLGRHINVSAKLDLGIKNISYTDGLVNPSIYNYNVTGCVGYEF